MKKPTAFAWTLTVPMTIALATLGLASVAHATKKSEASRKLKAKELTCEEFLELGSEAQPRVVYWIEGVSDSGKPEAEIDVESLERPVAMVVTECRKTPKATVWEKIEHYF